MNNQEKIPWTLIQKALKQNMNDEDQKMLETWLSESASNRKIYRKLKIAWNLTGENRNSYQPDEKEAWNRIVKHAGIKYSDRIAISNLRRKKMLHFLRNAAAILFIPALVTTILLYHNLTIPGESAIVSVTTQKGQQTDVSLDDGTQVWLNASSVITGLPSRVAGETRYFLEGEAYFEVADQRPGAFVVSTSHMEIRVTGTSFNVRSYPEENTIETVLEEGTVEVLSHENERNSRVSAVLQPGQKAVYDKATQNFEISETGTTDYSAWRDGILVFRNVTFEELARRLEQWFDVEIFYEPDQFDDSRYTGVFRNRENIHQVLESIGMAMPFEYHMDRNQIFIE